MSSTIWGRHDLAPDGLSIEAGNGRWQFRAHQGDCCWRLERGDEFDSISIERGAAPLNEGDWQRWTAGGDIGCVILKPALANRSLVVRPRFPLSLAAHRELTVYVGLPLWLQACSSHLDDAPVFCDQPLMELSKTWFGTPIAGEPAYQLRTKALRNTDDILPMPAWRALCTLTIANRGKLPLPVERICIRCPNLELFHDDNGYCSGAIRATVNDPGEAAEVELKSGPPPGRAQAKRVSPARHPISGLIHHLAVATKMGL